MREIPVVTREGAVRFVVTVDDEDFDWARGYSWHALGTTASGTGYAGRTNGKTQSYMHREILARMGFPDCEMGDHKDRNPLNNCRSNLRPATASINANNRDNTNTGRKRTLPDAEPRACKQCGTVFTPRRKSPGRIYCSVACQRAGVLTHDSQTQSRRAYARWDGGFGA